MPRKTTPVLRGAPMSLAPLVHCQEIAAPARR